MQACISPEAFVSRTLLKHILSRQRSFSCLPLHMAYVLVSLTQVPASGVWHSHRRLRVPKTDRCEPWRACRGRGRGHVDAIGRWTHSRVADWRG